MKKITLFFVNVILFTTVAFSQAKDTIDRNVHVYVTLNPYPYQPPMYIPQQQTDLFKSRPKTFGDILLSIQQYFDSERYGNTNNFGYYGNYYGNAYPGVDYRQMNYLMSLCQISPNVGSELCNTCFDYSPEIRPYETLVATLKVSDLGDTAKIDAIQKQYRYFRIGKKVYNMYGVQLIDSVPVFARIEDEATPISW